jgi:hypothetical protein
MDQEREQEIVNRLAELRHSEVATLLTEYLSAKREKYRDQLERVNSDELRGKAQECRNTLQLFC